MSNGTESAEVGRKSKKSLKEQMADFVADGGKIEQLPSATEADAERATVNPTLQADSNIVIVPPRVILPKDFPCFLTRQGDIDCYSLSMSYQDVVDYTCYAIDLYDSAEFVQVGSGKRSKSKMPVELSWQRELSKRRVMGTDKKDGEHVAGIVDYLAKPVHFFPPLVCVPAQSLSGVDDSHLHLMEDSLGILDGQHRRAAIEEWLSRHPDCNDSVSVIVLNIPHDDIDRKQQIFADVNRTPAKVSKALSIVFDHDDKVSTLAKQIVSCSRRTYVSDENGTQVEYTNHPLAAYVEMSALSPSANANQICSLMNIYNLIAPMMAVSIDGERRLSDDNIEDVVLAILFGPNGKNTGLPRVDAIREGRVNFKDVKLEYIWPYSTIWKALGECLASQLTKRDPEGHLAVDPQGFALQVGSFVKSFGKDGWSLDNDRWRQSGRMVVVDKKVLTRSENIKSAIAVLNDYFTL